MSHPHRTWTVFALIILLLAACSQTLKTGPNLEQPSAALIGDAEINHASLELASGESEISGVEKGSAPDAAEIDLPSSEHHLSTQAVLPGVGGYLSYIRIVRDTSTTWQLWLANQVTDERRLVYQGNRTITSTAVNQAGTTLFFTAQAAAGSSNHEVYRLTLSNKSVTRLTSTPAAEADVSVSANGQTLVWGSVNASTAKRAVFLRLYSGTSYSQKVLGIRTGNQFEPTVSGDGAYIAFIRQTTSTQVMRFRKSDSSYLVVSTPSTGVYVKSPSVSNGGLKAAWGEDTKTTQSSVIKVKTISSGSVTRVGRSPSRIQHPHLTSDGAYVTYASLHNGTYNVSTKNLSTGQIARLTADTSSSITNAGAFWQKGPSSGSSTFSVTCSPDALTLAKATTTTITCTVTSTNGFTAPATISSTGLASGLSAEPFVKSLTVPANASARFAMAVNARAVASLGKTSFKVNVAAAGAVKTDSVQVSVVATSPRVRLIYLVPSDKEPNTLAIKGMDRAIRHLQIWYQSEMGTGRTLTVSYPAVQVVRTTHSSSWYSTNPNGDNHSSWFWNNALADGFALTGGSFYDQENIWLYYIDAETAQGQVTGGNASVAVLPGWDVRGVAGQESAGICRWVGGLGHELGHALLLPHPQSCDAGLSGCPYDALMWTGYSTYPSAFLTGEDKEHLKTSPFFASRPVTTRLFDCSSLKSQAVFWGHPASKYG